MTRQGYEVVNRNFTVVKNGKIAGEVDIIAWHHKYHFGKTLCFIEVKTRSYGEGSAERATNKAQKMEAFFTTARKYCLNNKIDIDLIPIQFEQVSVYVSKKKDGSAKVVFRKFEIPID